MTETKQFICINCPVGCPLELDHEGDRIIEVDAPVAVGQVLLQGLLGQEGLDVVATRSMERR